MVARFGHVRAKFTGVDLRVVSATELHRSLLNPMTAIAPAAPASEGIPPAPGFRGL
jgi:hypothetical protein